MEICFIRRQVEERKDVGNFSSRMVSASRRLQLKVIGNNRPMCPDCYLEIFFSSFFFLDKSRFVIVDMWRNKRKKKKILRTLKILTVIVLKARLLKFRV